MVEPQFRIVLSTGKGRFYWTGQISVMGVPPSYGWAKDSYMLPHYSESKARVIADAIRAAMHPLFTDIVIAVEPLHISREAEEKRRTQENGRMAEW